MRKPLYFLWPWLRSTARSLVRDSSYSLNPTLHTSHMDITGTVKWQHDDQRENRTGWSWHLYLDIFHFNNGTRFRIKLLKLQTKVAGLVNERNHTLHLELYTQQRHLFLEQKNECSVCVVLAFDSARVRSLWHDFTVLYIQTSVCKSIPNFILNLVEWDTKEIHLCSSVFFCFLSYFVCFIIKNILHLKICKLLYKSNINHL